MNCKQCVFSTTIIIDDDYKQLWENIKKKKIKESVYYYETMNIVFVICCVFINDYACLPL